MLSAECSLPQPLAMSSIPGWTPMSSSSAAGPAAWLVRCVFAIIDQHNAQHPDRTLAKKIFTSWKKAAKSASTAYPALC